MSSTSEPYILNTIQTPYGLQKVYESIGDDNGTAEAIAADTGLDEDSLTQLLDGLIQLGLIRRSQHAYQVVETQWETGNPTRDFRMSALHNLATAVDAADWGKQAVVLLNYRYLLEQNIQRFENDQQPLYENIDYWIRVETDYRPKDGDEIYEHNDNKFGNWTRLVHTLGLVYKVSGREHVVYPDPDIVRTSIDLAAQQSQYVTSGAADLSIREYLEWLDTNLLPIGYTSGDAVPPVLSRVLYALVRELEIELVESGDAGAVSLSNTPRRDGIEKDANAIKIL